jgi:ferritin-like metal-binding protein YciE
MDTINNLVDLLIHQVQNLYAAEEQMQKAMPAIIERAHHSSLKNALKHHLQLTEEQKDRLQQVMQLVHKKAREAISTISQGQQSKGMTGLIEELNEVLSFNLAAEVTDAAIIAYVQKMEHYEISTYGTAHAFAKQMRLHEAENLLTETLNEEYDVDDLLTALATAALNKEAIPEVLQTDDNPQSEENYISDVESRPAKVSVSERSINSPGGRAGTSHRRYGSGESRGH